MNESAMLLSVALPFLATMVGQAVDDDFNEPIDILADDGRKIGQLPAQRDPLPFDGDRGDARLGVARAGPVYAAMGDTLCWTEDGGKSWQSRNLPVEAGGFGVLRDDTFIVFGGSSQCWVIRSTDYGETWSEKIPLDVSPFTRGGGGWTQISQPPGYPALMVITLRHGTGSKDADGNPLPLEKLGIHDHIYRSTDSGRTWGDRSLIVRDSAESSVLLLKSGKMLVAIRKQRVSRRELPDDDAAKLKAQGTWMDGKPFFKHGFLAESDDKGYTWHDERTGPVAHVAGQVTQGLGLCPSELIQLPDGRVVWIYTQTFRDGPRVLLGEGQGVYARISDDEGATWSAHRYLIRLLKSPGYTPYPASTVLPDGTILTVIGTNRAATVGENPAMAIRWRPEPIGQVE